MTPDLSVIIPHYADETRLSRCLEALFAQDLAGVEIIVADNNSPHGIAGIADRFPHARIVVQPQPGAGLARNAGVEASTAPWLAFVDADCLPADDWIAVARRIAGGDANAVTGGRVDVFDETPRPRSGAEAFETVFAFRMERYLTEEGFLGAGNLVVSRAVFDRTGPFLGAVAEDVEWSRRAARAGATLAYDDALRVGHPSRPDWSALRHKWQRMTREAWALRLQSRGGGQGSGRATWALRALAMPASVLAHTPRVLGHEALSGRERLRALATLGRIRLARMSWMLAQAWRGD